MRIVRGLVGDRSSDGLADPPGRVRRELEALDVVELLDRPHQAEVALLDEVEEEHPPAHVALRDRHDEPQVRLDQLGLRVLAVDDVAPEPALVHEVALGEAVLREHPGLDPLRELHLFGAGQQPDSTDLLEVHPHGIGGRADRTRGIPIEQRRAQPSWRHHLVFDGFDLFARATRIGDRGLERDGREDLAVIELFDTLVECDAVFSEEVTPRDDRVFVEVDVLDHEHELLVADDGRRSQLPRGEVRLEILWRHAPQPGRSRSGLGHHLSSS